ncbi:MAG: zinc-dependent peptidase [Sphingobacteriales bacterium]|nr:zinc-dependent peptidase [Sphingobacteriales bacterium]
MPGDTSIIIFPDSVLHDNYYLTGTGDTIWLPPPPPDSAGLVFYSEYTEPDNGKSTGLPEFVIVIGMAILLISLALRKKENEEEEYAVRSPKMRKALAMEKAVENGKIYDEWLSRYNPYYKSLSPELRERFLLRTIEFAQAKEFRFHAMVEEDYMLILLSGAAIQLTFGLRNYMLDYFPVIHVIRQEYTLDIDKETYYGHVSKNGIYISWTHFMDGYRDYSDSINVGLHEMAHAVSYDVFLGAQDRHDHGFIERLQDFREEGTPVFRALRRGASHLLDDYAATNFDEFWAVCIETFFENPVEFRDTMPGLYQCICDILNQDPARPGIIIDKEMAGMSA